VDAPCIHATNKPSATADAQFEQVSWALGEISMHSMLEGEELSPASPPYGCVGRLQTEVRIINSISEIPHLPLSFEDNMERADVEGNQKLLSTSLESRAFHEDYNPTRHKQVRPCNEMLNLYPSKPKHVKSFETASTYSSLVSDESITRLYQDRNQEQPQIDGTLSLTDIFSWSNKGEIKTVPPTVFPTDAPRTKEHCLHGHFPQEQKITKRKRRDPPGPIDLDTGLPSGPIQIDTELPPNCNQDDSEESYYSLQPPSMIESSCSSSSEGGDSNPLLRKSTPFHARSQPFHDVKVDSQSSSAAFIH
jgi:hypothetical protein